MLGRFWDLHGPIFGWFSLIQFWYHFLDVFWEKMQKLEKWKHSSGPVNYSVLWRSPRSNKNIILPKKTLWLFIIFRSKIEQKPIGKPEKNAVCNKSWWKRGPWDHFLGQGLIFGGFWDPVGDPKIIQNRTLGLKIRIWLARGVPREPQEPILVDFCTILESFWVPRWSFWDLPGTLLGATSSKQQQR